MRSGRDADGVRAATDENIDFAVVTFLRVCGFDVLDVKEEGLFGQEDRVLLQRTVAERRIVLTHDSDFGALAVASGEPYLGVVYLRPGHVKPEFTVGTLRTLLAQNPAVNPPFIVVATRTGARVNGRVRRHSVPWNGSQTP